MSDRERGVLILGLSLLALAGASLALRWAQAALPGADDRRLVLAVVAGLGLPAGAALVILRRAVAARLIPLLSICFGVAVALGLFVLVDLGLGCHAWLVARAARPAESDLHQRDPLLSWVPRPGAVFRHRLEGEFDVEYRIDAGGFREASQPASAQRRFFFFGDSFTFGHGVEDEEVFTAVMAREYLDPGVRVLNAGVRGYGLVQMYARYQALQDQVQPGDLVVFAPLAIDLWRNMDDFFYLALVLYDPFFWTSSFPRFEDGRLEARPLSTPWNWVRAPFFGARYSKRFFRRLNRAVTGPRSMAQAREILAAAESLSRERRARFFLTFLPDDSELRDGEYSFDLRPFDYVDLRRYFPAEEGAVRELYYPRDRHWNPEGHRVAARALTASLLEAGALEPGELRPGAAARLEPPGVVAKSPGRP